jgi:DNA-binding response OmpR family regulator
MKLIVIIEDNAVAANLYRSALSREGYKVEVATDGASGLETITRLKPDLVLLDLMLPKVDGAEVLRRIRALSGFEQLPVIVTSNAYTTARLDDLWKAGATQIVTKASISPKDLARVVKETLDRTPPPPSQ